MFSAGGVSRNLEFLDFFEKLGAVLLAITRFRSEIYQVVTILKQLLLGNFDHGFGGAHQPSRRPIGRTAQRRQPAEIGAVARTSFAPRPESAGRVAGRPGPPLADPLAYQARPITMGPLRRASYENTHKYM